MSPAGILFCVTGFLIFQVDVDCCHPSLLAELKKLKTQLEVPGSTGTLTGAADRKLEEGQRVGVLNPLPS